MQNKTDKVKQNIFKRATLFIEQNGSIAPFGTKIVNNEIRDVILNDDFDENNKGEDLISVLKENFSIDLQNHNIEIGGIAFDVIIKIKNALGILEKRDAICIIISIDGKNWDEEYFPYKIIDGNCIWK